MMANTYFLFINALLLGILFNVFCTFTNQYMLKMSYVKLLILLLMISSSVESL